MSIDATTLLIGPLVMLLAYTVFGISGFGSALISIPLLAHLLVLSGAALMVRALGAG